MTIVCLSMHLQVQESWLIIQTDLEENGVKFFLHVFEIAPELLTLFSFGRNGNFLLALSPLFRVFLGLREC